MKSYICKSLGTFFMLFLLFNSCEKHEKHEIKKETTTKETTTEPKR